MTRIIVHYGLISGAIAAGGITATIVLSGGQPPHSSLWLGYLITLVALSSILIGVKQYRDGALGGLIGFWKAFGIGVGIAAVAGLAYIAVWEAYVALAHYDFASDYARAVLASKRAARSLSDLLWCGVDDPWLAHHAIRLSAVDHRPPNDSRRRGICAAHALPDSRFEASERPDADGYAPWRSSSDCG